MKEIKNYIKSVVAEMRSDVERINSYASMPAQAGAFYANQKFYIVKLESLINMLERGE